MIYLEDVAVAEHVTGRERGSIKGAQVRFERNISAEEASERSPGRMNLDERS
jgi:hypothetical protein